MRRCMIFFTLLILTVIIAVITERHAEIPKQSVVVTGDTSGYDLLAAEEGFIP